jgi:hypothetical protein
MDAPMMATCFACGRSLGLADLNGLHVADEAHYAHRDDIGALDCTWLSERPLEPSTAPRGGPGPAGRLSAVPAVPQVP